MSIKLSIIVPVYNVEQYLCKCIDSILNQTFSDFELIIIDDGSPDNCDIICDEYVKKDKRIKVIHQENIGLVGSRKNGIKLAQGEYVGFVDSDDWIDSDMYEILIKDIEKYNADIAICNMSKSYKNGKEIPLSNNDEFLVLDAENAIKYMLEGKIFKGYLVNRLYKKKLFDCVEFNTTVVMCEDLLTSYYLFNASKKITYTPIKKYHYLQRENSICNSSFSIDLWTMTKVGKIIHENVKNLYPNIHKHSFSMYMDTYIACGMSVITCNGDYEEYFKVVQTEIRKNIMKFIKSDIVRGNQKKRALQLLLPYHLNRVFGRFRRLINKMKKQY